MKILLTTLNSKYIHSNLAIRYLAAFCQDQFPDIDLREYTINAQLGHLAGEIYGSGAQIIGFSCYIWNLEAILKIAETLKKANPKLIIILGGPEVSFGGQEIMVTNQAVDFIIEGEGEKPFEKLMQLIRDKDRSYNQVKGLIYRSGERVLANPKDEPIITLDQIPSPYAEPIPELAHKIVYYETSRGCPFNCQYCLSSTHKGLRFFSLDRVKVDLTKLIEAKVKQVKLVDRTFNCNKQRTIAFLQFIREMDMGLTNFHLEVAADLFDTEVIKVLAQLRPGLVQLEIGVQSTHADTLRIIDRKTNLRQVKDNVLAMASSGNIHLHLDLIAGLPGESYYQFAKSFDDVYGMNPEMLQLGFLKLLKGSGLRQKAQELGLVYSSYPPYEIISNRDITYEEILKLKQIEEMVEIYYNTHRFSRTIKELIEKVFPTPFTMYESLASFWHANEWHLAGQGQVQLYRNLWEFILSVVPGETGKFKPLLTQDYLEYNSKAKLPPWLI